MPLGWRRGLAGAMLALSLLCPERGEGQLSVSRTEVRLIVDGDREDHGYFIVRNHGAEAVDLSLAPADWNRDLHGEHRFEPAGTSSGSCASGLRLSPPAVRLGPGEERRIGVSLVGLDPDRPCHSIVFVEGAPAAGMMDGQNVRLITRYGIKVYGTPPGARGRLTVARFSETESGLRLEAVAQGNAPVRAEGTVEFRRADNSVAATLPVPPFGMLPGTRRVLELPLPELPEGRYVALVMLDDGGADLAAGHLEFAVP